MGVYKNFKPELISALKNGLSSEIKIFGARPKTIKQIPCVILSQSSDSVPKFGHQSFIRDFQMIIDIYASSIDEAEDILTDVISTIEALGWDFTTSSDLDSDVDNIRHIYTLFSCRYDGQTMFSQI